MASALGGVQGLLLGQLNNPSMTKTILKTLGSRGRIFYPLFHNTVSPTVLHGSSKINVIPNEVSIELDGRMLPGFKPEEMLNELRQIVGDGVALPASIVAVPIGEDQRDAIKEQDREQEVRPRDIACRRSQFAVRGSRFAVRGSRQ